MLGGREEQLQEVFAQQGALLEVRMVRDHFTGAPRGFAFAHFHTVSDAAKALAALQVGSSAAASCVTLEALSARQGGH